MEVVGAGKGKSTRRGASKEERCDREEEDGHVADENSRGWGGGEVPRIRRRVLAVLKL